jgi:hypothetical protein
VEAVNHDRERITRDQEQPFRLFSVAARLGDDTVLLRRHADRRGSVPTPMTIDVFRGCLSHNHGNSYLLNPGWLIPLAKAREGT